MNEKEFDTRDKRTVEASQGKSNNATCVEPLFLLFLKITIEN
jgi:hypothetical protein